MGRITGHPILSPPGDREVAFFFKDTRLRGLEGEPVTSALIAAGIHIFGKHPRDASPQGLFCANGQCSQCTVLVNGIPVKGCMTPLAEGMRVEPCIGKPVLPPGGDAVKQAHLPGIRDVPFLVIGGGPAGLSAAAVLGRLGVEGILADDKGDLGGKLCLQTHKFFGSREACHAGVRGIDIAGILEEEVKRTGTVDTWRSSPGLGVFSDGVVGVLRDGRRYTRIRPEVLVIAAGAREKSLLFPGCDLPGVMGAGAFQTLVNRDGVLPGKRLFIIGGGNVGLIVAYHALQAGIEVVGLAEYTDECGGYQVHEDKIRRLGVPVFTGHTVLGAEGTEHVRAVTIAVPAGDGGTIPGTEKRFEIDTLLVAVGLSPVDELYIAARRYGMKVFAAGDAEEISEASAAMIGGRIRGRQAARALGISTPDESDLEATAAVLKARPGPRLEDPGSRSPGGTDIPGSAVYPVIRCYQEIPCNPCTEVCPLGAITIPGGGITGIPVFDGNRCTGCAKCVLACPGLAITLVDERPGNGRARVTIPWELSTVELSPGRPVNTVDRSGHPIGSGVVCAVRKGADRCSLVVLEVPFEHRAEVSSILPPADEDGMNAVLRRREASDAGPSGGHHSQDTAVVCRCERVTRGEILEYIRRGYRDMNSLKAALRTSMGACGGKTCESLILQIFAEEGIPPEDITGFTKRPPVQEVSLGLCAGVESDGDPDAG